MKKTNNSVEFIVFGVAEKWTVTVPKPSLPTVVEVQKDWCVKIIRNTDVNFESIVYGVSEINNDTPDVM